MCRHNRGRKLGHWIYWTLGTAIAAALAGGLVWAVATKRLGHYGPYMAGAAIFGVLWTVWPYWSLYKLQTAIAEGDQVSLASSVDWQSVRTGIGDDLKAAYMARIVSQDPRAQQIAQSMSATIIDRTVQTQVNPGTLAGLSRRGPQVGSNPMENVRGAFFQGSPFVFRADIGPAGSSVDPADDLPPRMELGLAAEARHGRPLSAQSGLIILAARVRKARRRRHSTR